MDQTQAGVGQHSGVTVGAVEAGPYWWHNRAVGGPGICLTWLEHSEFDAANTAALLNLAWAHGRMDREGATCVTVERG